MNDIGDYCTFDEEHQATVLSCIKWVVLTQARIQILQLLNPEGEYECVGDINGESLAECGTMPTKLQSRVISMME